MTLRDRMSKVADKVRGLASKASIDERTTSVTVRTVTYVGGRRGAEGPRTTVDLLLAPRPKIVEVNGRDIAGSAGRYAVGDVKVGPITPTYTGGGYTQDQLAPALTSNGVDVLYVLAGGVAGEYTRIDFITGRSHTYFLVLRRKRTTP